MSKQIIGTEQAPAAIGTYSQAVRVGDLVYLSGQIALDPQSMEMVNDTIEAEIQQVFKNMSAVCHAAGADLNSLIKITVYLTDLGHFAKVNEVMQALFDEPYPARAAIGVTQLPKNAQVEVEAILNLA